MTLSPYELRHLAAHLQSSGRHDCLHELLAWETDAERNLWYDARDAANEIDGYLDDLSRAWRLAEGVYDASDAHKAGVSIALQCRYALMVASLHAIAGRIPTGLLTSLMQHGVFSRDQALAYAGQAADPEREVEALVSLMPYLTDSERDSALRQALRAARAIEDKDWHEPDGAQARALASLIPHLRVAERSRIVREALEVALGSDDDQLLSEALAELAPHLSESLLRETLPVACSVCWPEARERLAFRFAELGFPDDALGVISTISERDIRVKALADLAPRLPDGDARKALRTAETELREIRDPKDRAQATARLAPRLPTSGRLRVVREALALAVNVTSSYAKAVSLTLLAPHLPLRDRHHAMREAMSAIRQVEEGWARGTLLTDVAPHLPRPLMKEALATARNIEKITGWRSKALVALAVRLADLGHPRDAIDEAHGLDDPSGQAAALMGVAQYLPSSEQVCVLRTAVEIALSSSESPEHGVRPANLHKLASKLAELGHIDEALVAARGIKKEHQRLSAMVALAPYLPRPLLLETFEAACKKPDEHSRSNYVTSITPHLTDHSILRDAVVIAQEIGDSESQVRSIAGLSPWLTMSALREVLERVHDVETPFVQAELVAELAPHLSERLALKALSVTQDIESDYWRAEALAALAKYLPEPQSSHALKEALALALSQTDIRNRATALAAQGEHLSEELLQVALDTAHRTGAAEIILRAEVLAKLAPHLPETERETIQSEALETAGGDTGTGDFRADILASLAPLLPEPLLREALTIAQRFSSEWFQATALAGLAPRLAELGFITEAFEATKGIESRRSRALAESGLASYSPEPLLQETLMTVAQALEDAYYRRKPLTRLAHRVSQYRRSKLYPIWCELLHILAARTRADLLEDIHALSSCIAALGGGKAIEGTLRAVQDTSRWWP